MMKKFMVYLDDGQYCYKVAVPAKDKKTAIEHVSGNGEVIAVKDVTEECLISAAEIFDALCEAEIEQIKIDFITRALREIGICE